MKPKFYRKVLKNGMTVIFEKRDVPVVSVAFAVRCGGINESSEEKGISHFIEHLLYKGTTNRNTRQIAEEIEKRGGDLNGFTDETITAYLCKMPSKHLDVALNVLSDIVKNPLFDKKELEKERKVIFEEIKMRRDEPKMFVFDEIQSFLYGPPLGENLIGTQKTMNSIDRDKIVKRFKEVYSPNNLVLCVVGDADFEKLIEFCERNFGGGKGKVPEFKVEDKNEVKVIKRKGIDQANLIFAFHVPKSEDKKHYAAHVLSVLMGGGFSSRLFEEIREKRNLAYAIKTTSSVNKDFSYSLVYVGTSKENVELVKKIIIDEYKKVSEGLTEKELKEVKEQIIGNHHISMEDSLIQMSGLLYHEMNGSAEDFYRFEDGINSVKIDDVKELAKKATKNYSFLALVPE